MFISAWSESGDAESISFEERAYETIISSVIGSQTLEYEMCVSQALDVLSAFKVASIISIERQEQMRMIKNKVVGMIAKVNAYRLTLFDLLEDDVDLAMMNLSLLKRKPSLYK